MALLFRPLSNGVLPYSFIKEPTELTIRTDGDDEVEAMQALTDLINDYFGEGE